MYTRLVLFTLAGFALWALGRNRPDPRIDTPATARVADTVDPFAHDVDRTRARARSSFSKRRLATSLTFATLFFAGAALSAGAGDMVAEMVDETTSAAAETTTEEAPAEEAPAEEAPPAEAPAEEPAEAPAEEPASEPAEEPSHGDDGAGGGGGGEEPADDGGSGGGGSADQGGGDDGQGGGGEEPADDGDSGGGDTDQGEEPAGDGGDNGSDEGESEPEEEEEPAPAPKDDEPSHDSEPESGDESEHSTELPAEPPAETSTALETESGFATIWLHRVLPDPTPPARRLTPDFARRLSRTAKAYELDWAFMLAVLRASGHRASEPASPAGLELLARQLTARNASEEPWKAALAYAGRTAFADRTMALTAYHHAVGLRSLVTGLKAATDRLEEAVLFDPRIDMYAGGVTDVQSGRIDVRVLVLLLYLAERHGQVTVSSLKTGHGFFARPGVPSAHMYGLAVDISALEGRPIMGNQAPGGLTEEAVRNILLLPVQLRPRQVISLLGLGGPSFPLEDHYDHIHVGY